MRSRKGIGGRPRLNPEAKASYFNMRTTPALRARVEASRRAHGTASFVQEVERLVKSALDAQEGQTIHR
jgi:hypothetical protein